MRWLRRLVTAQLRRNQRILGRCPTVSAGGYICTLTEPHLWHEAHLDGRVLDRWIDPADQPVWA